MLANTLNTNEIKNAAGAEVEFTHLSQNERKRVFAQVNEPYSNEHRLEIAHEEVGSGVDKVRRSKVGFKKVINGQVDTTKASPIEFYVVGKIPVGNMTSQTEAQNVLAELMSFIATTGAATTVLFDGTGNGARCLLGGEV